MDDQHIERFYRGLPMFLIMETVALGFPFLIGALAGLATPGGWAAWQIGFLVTAIMGTILTIVVICLVIDYMTHNYQ